MLKPKESIWRLWNMVCIPRVGYGIFHLYQCFSMSVFKVHCPAYFRSFLLLHPCLVTSEICRQWSLTTRIIVKPKHRKLLKVNKNPLHPRNHALVSSKWKRRNTVWNEIYSLNMCTKISIFLTFGLYRLSWWLLRATRYLHFWECWISVLKLAKRPWL